MNSNPDDAIIAALAEALEDVLDPQATVSEQFKDVAYGDRATEATSMARQEVPA